jgi:hypothetical protein
MTGRRRYTLAGPKCVFEENHRIGPRSTAAGRTRVSPGPLQRYANHLDFIGQIGRIGLIGRMVCPDTPTRFTAPLTFHLLYPFR